MGKNLKINCATCDVRNVREAYLQAYDSVRINCASILATPESQALMGKYNVMMNCADVLVVGSDVKVKTINGKARIGAEETAMEPCYYIVNGMLEIEAGAEAVLEKCLGIRVNGMVLYPQSLAGRLGMMEVNGKVECYPDEAVLLKKDAVIDRVFVLRAKEKLYWAAKRLIMVDPRLDGEALAKKGVKFSAPEAIIAESKVESLIDLIDEKAEIVIVPDGTVVVNDDLELNKAALERYGRKLYVLGDVTAEQGAAEAVEPLEYLNVRGDVTTAANVMEALLAKTESIGGELHVYQGKVFRNVPEMKVSTDLLELEAEGVTLVECACVRIDPQVTAPLIREKLRILECAAVECTPEQRAAVSLVSQNVPFIGNLEDEEKEEEDENTVKINAANYVM